MAKKILIVDDANVNASLTKYFGSEESNVSELKVNPKTLLFENLTPKTVRLLKDFSDEIFINRKLNYRHPVIQMWYTECPVGEERLAIMLDVLHQKILASIVEYFMAGNTL